MLSTHKQGSDASPNNGYDYKNWLLRAGLIAAVLGVLLPLFKHVPYEVTLELIQSQPVASATKDVEILYLFNDEILRGVRQHFPQGLPKRFIQEASLTQGQYEIRVSAADISLRGNFEVQHAGTIRVHLHSTK